MSHNSTFTTHRGQATDIIFRVSPVSLAESTPRSRLVARPNPPPRKYSAKSPSSSGWLHHRLDNLFELPAPFAKLCVLRQRHRRRIDILGLADPQIALETKLGHQKIPNCRKMAITQPANRIASAIRASRLCFGSSGSYRSHSGICIDFLQKKGRDAQNFVDAHYGTDWFHYGRPAHT